ncbi:hypothetical protein ACGF13_14270 [Kitasatospora sp. NPDC048286]|uniref:hypothetical protein n=1 Tax=Kitasatospora sp. NPDC048286 TaxID=3364047 RepID=UPI00372001E2
MEPLQRSLAERDEYTSAVLDERIRRKRHFDSACTDDSVFSFQANKNLLFDTNALADMASELEKLLQYVDEAAEASPHDLVVIFREINRKAVSIHDIGKASPEFQAWPYDNQNDYGGALGSTRERVKEAANCMRLAASIEEKRASARAFLQAVAELVLCLLRFLVRALLALLSRSLGCANANSAPTHKPVPIDLTPQITPRGPNSAFPVITHRGGLRSSALGNVVVAA